MINQETYDEGFQEGVHAGFLQAKNRVVDLIFAKADYYDEKYHINRNEILEDIQALEVEEEVS